MKPTVKKPEPTLDDLLADPMMEGVLHYAGTSPEALRSLMRDARERLAKAQAGESDRPDTAEG
jgi:hypothetical protein